jgi:hypothetical protein
LRHSSWFCSVLQDCPRCAKRPAAASMRFPAARRRPVSLPVTNMPAAGFCLWNLSAMPTPNTCHLALL